MTGNPQSGIERALGELVGEMKGLNKQVSQVQADLKESDEKSAESRSRVYIRLDENNTRISHLESSLTRLTGEVRDVRAVTDDVKQLRQQAQGAGTLGHWLIRIGIAVLAIAGWLVSAYTWVTGRPPP